MVTSEATTGSSITRLLREGALDPGLAGLVWLLAHARVPVLVAGQVNDRPDREVVRDAVAALAAPALRRVRIGPLGEGLEQLKSADVGATVLVGMDIGPAPAPALQVAFKALARGAVLVASIEGGSLEHVRARLRRPDLRLSDDELSFIGLVVIVGRPVVDAAPVLRVTAAHYVRPIARDLGGHIQRSGPAVLATWEPSRDSFEDFSWGIAAELAGRAGLRPGDLEAEVVRRGSFLAGLASRGVLEPHEVGSAVAAFQLASSPGPDVVDPARPV